MKILLANNNQFPLPGTNNRFWHLATLNKGFREFMVFKDGGIPYISEEKIYIEEQVGAQLVFISDDNLAEELAIFARENNILVVKPLGWYV